MSTGVPGLHHHYALSGFNEPLYPCNDMLCIGAVAELPVAHPQALVTGLNHLLHNVIGILVIHHNHKSFSFTTFDEVLAL